MYRSARLKERLDKTTLEKLYHQSELSTVQIAERFGTQHSRVLKLMEEYGIPRRSRGGGKSADPRADRANP